MYVVHNDTDWPVLVASVAGVEFIHELHRAAFISPRCACPGHYRGLRPARPLQTVNPASASASTRTPALWPNHATPRTAGPGCRSSGASVLAALMTAGEPQQPGYFSHSDAAAAPVDRFPQRKTLIAGHCPQRLPSALLSAPNESIAFTQRGQHRGRQSFEPAFPVGRSLRSTACASNAERRAACRTDC
jgi:hypothetical protein